MTMNQVPAVSWGSFTIEGFKILSNDALTAIDYKVFFYLLGHMNPGTNTAKVRQKQISEDLLVHKTSVSKSVKQLEDLQYIVKNVDIGGYMINPLFYYVDMNMGPDDNTYDTLDELRADFAEFVMVSGFKVRFDLKYSGDKVTVADHYED